MDLSLIIDGARVTKRASPRFKCAYDIAVLGLGTAGAEALAELASASVRVIGVEHGEGLGGLGTIGGISYWNSIPDKLREYERRCRMADVLYESTVIGIWTDGDRIVGVRFCRHGIICDVAARVVIDATGNATVARILGLPLRKGRPSDGALAPLSRAESWQNADGVVNPRYANYFRDPTLSIEEYSEIVSFLSKERHGNWSRSRKDARMIMPALMVAAREECRVTTEEILSMRDELVRNKFDKPVFYAFGPEDLPIGGLAYESEEIQNWKVLCGLALFGYPTTVTYGMLVAKGVANLFVPSKHFGVSHDLGGTLRMQDEMKKTGAVAAWAALTALRIGCPAKDVPYAELRPVLERAGYLKLPPKTEMDSVRGFSFRPFAVADVVHALRCDVVRTGEWWRTEAKGGADEQAAYAYWTAWHCGLRGTSEERRVLGDALAEAAMCENRFLGNYAVALGLLHDLRAIPHLRKVLAEPGGPVSPFIRNSTPNVTKALILLGRLSDVESLPLLSDIVEDGAVSLVARYKEAGVFVGDEESIRSELLAYALMSIKRILQVHPNPNKITHCGYTVINEKGVYR